MDDTQQLIWDCEEQEREQEGSEREPRGRLRMFGGSRRAQTDFIIYGGLNVIGRNESCHVYIPVQSVSKKHAVIDVERDSHVIHDCNSLNKTRRKNVIFKPHIRYQINDGDVFLFGDVACQYLVLPPAAQDVESGSDTNSESMLPQSQALAGTERRAEGHPIPEAAGQDLEWADDSLMLSPTPSYQHKLPGQLVQADIYVKESEDDDTPWKESRSFTSQAASISIRQTPSANVVPESDDEAENTSRSNLQPAPLHYDSDTDLEEDQQPGEEKAEHSTMQPADATAPRAEVGAVTGQDPAPATGETVLNRLSGSEETTTKEPGEEDNEAVSSGEPASQPSADVRPRSHASEQEEKQDSTAERVCTAGPTDTEAGHGSCTVAQGAAVTSSTVGEEVEGPKASHCVSNSPVTQEEATKTMGSAEEVNGMDVNCDTDVDDDMSDFYALQPTQCFVLSASNTQGETAAEEKCTTHGAYTEEEATQVHSYDLPSFNQEPSSSEPATTHSLEEDATQPFILPSSVFSREPCQEAFTSDADHRKQLGEGTGSPGVECSEEAETDVTGIVPSQRSEPRDQERLEAGVEIRASQGREQAVEVEQAAEAGAALVPAAADLTPVPADIPTRSDGGSYEEPPAATGLSEVLGARQRAPCQREMEGAESRGSPERREPGGEASDPGTVQNSRTGVRHSRRKPRAAEPKPGDGSQEDAVVPQERGRRHSSGLAGGGEDRSREAGRNARRSRRTRTRKPSAQAARNEGAAEETPAVKEKLVEEETPAAEEETSAVEQEPEVEQTPARPRRGKGRQRNSSQTAGDDHLSSPQQNPLIAPKARAKRRSVADPQSRTESESPPQKRPTTCKGVSSQEDGQETGLSSGRSRRSRVASEAGSEKGASTPPRVKTRRQTCQLSPSSVASLSETVPMPKEDGQETGLSSGRSRRSRVASEAGSEKGASTPPRVKTRQQTCQLSPSSVASLSETVPMPKVMFTGLVDEDGMKVIVQLGGEVVECVHDSTHLVTDRIRRTVKFLCAVARGIPVVTPEWLKKKSGRNSYFLSHRSFLLDDRDQEQNFNFKLKDSLQKAKEQPLLQDYRIHVTAGVQPDQSQMGTILRCSGATVLPKMPRTYKEKTLVISCPDDLAKCKAARDAGIPVMNAEFILTGILQQTVDLVKHRLDGDETNKAEAKGRKRGSTRPAAAKKKQR